MGKTYGTCNLSGDGHHAQETETREKKSMIQRSYGIVKELDISISNTYFVEMNDLKAQ